MIVELRCDAGRPRAWIADAVRALASQRSISVRWIDTKVAAPLGLASLFDLERMILRRGQSDGSDIIDKHDVPQSSDAEKPDVVIDFTDVPRSTDCIARRYLRPLYNNLAGEDAALTAILSGDLPVIDIRDEVKDRVIDRGQPSAEIATGLSGSLAAVMTRTVTLLKALLDDRTPLPTSLAPSESRRPIADARTYVTRGVTAALLKRIYHICCYAPQWHVGWRLSDETDVWTTGDLSGRPWQRLANRPHCFYADPFPMIWNGRTFVFFEELDHRVGKGVISAIEFNDAGPVGNVLPILEEPWHLSYPHMIEDGGELWMIPESSVNNDVALYRCVEFPHRWERHATLISGIEVADATITRHQRRYYLFGVTRDGGGGYSDTLSIYHAERLTGPWQPHEKNPIMVDRANARPAGNFVIRDGRLWRPVQDCSNGYGAAMRLNEVTALSPDTFSQVSHHVLKPSAAWPGRKLHTLNRHGRLEVIDGSRIQLKIASILSE